MRGRRWEHGAGHERGGEKVKDKKSKAETKQAASPWRSEPLPVRKEVKDAEEPKSDKGPTIQERDKDAVIPIIGESEEYRKFAERLSKGCKKYLTAARESWDGTRER